MKAERAIYISVIVILIVFLLLAWNKKNKNAEELCAPAGQPLDMKCYKEKKRLFPKRQQP